MSDSLRRAPGGRGKEEGRKEGRKKEEGGKREMRNEVLSAALYLGSFHDTNISSADFSVLCCVSVSVAVAGQV